MRRFCLSALVAVVLTVPTFARGAGQAPTGASIWTVDTNHSSAGFTVRHMMVSNVSGTLGPVKGTIEYDGKSPESVSADISIDVSGINTGNTSRDNDLRNADGLFEIGKYPTVTFKSKKATAAGSGTFKLVGDLTIHGVTREVTLDVEGPSPALKQGNMLRVGATATTKINRRDFGLSYSRVVEAAPIVSDEVKITIDVEVTKRAA